MSSIASGRVEFLQDCIVDAYIKGLEQGIEEIKLRIIFKKVLYDESIVIRIMKQEKLKEKENETESKRIKSTD